MHKAGRYATHTIAIVFSTIDEEEEGKQKKSVQA